MAEHAEAKEEKSGGNEGQTFKNIALSLLYIFIVITTIIVAIVIAFINPETAGNFLKFLYGIEIFLAAYLLFLVYTVYTYIKKFQSQSEEIAGFYEKKYVPVKKDEFQLSPIEKRLNKAKAHIASQYREEWKIGILELDIILKDLLSQNGFLGDTVGELLESAEKKGFGALNLAWEAHKVRNRIAHEGINYEMNQDTAMRALRNYISAFEELGLK